MVNTYFRLYKLYELRQTQNVNSTDTDLGNVMKIYTKHKTMLYFST